MPEGKEGANRADFDVLYFGDHRRSGDNLTKPDNLERKDNLVPQKSAERDFLNETNPKNLKRKSVTTDLYLRIKTNHQNPVGDRASCKEKEKKISSRQCWRNEIFLMFAQWRKVEI